MDMFPRCADADAGKLDNVPRSIQKEWGFEPRSTGLQYSYFSVPSAFMFQIISFWELDVKKFKTLNSKWTNLNTLSPLAHDIDWRKRRKERWAWEMSFEQDLLLEGQA